MSLHEISLKPIRTAHANTHRHSALHLSVSKHSSTCMYLLYYQLNSFNEFTVLLSGEMSFIYDKQKALIFGLYGYPCRGEIFIFEGGEIFMFSFSKEERFSCANTI